MNVKVASVFKLEVITAKDSRQTAAVEFFSGTIIAYYISSFANYVK
jgi:hypothetical protein